MKTLGNILWHIPFLGFVSAIMMYLLGLLLTITIVAAPIGLGLMEYGKFLFKPFGNAMVSQSKLNDKHNSAWQAYSFLITILYFPIGLISMIIGICQVVGLFVSIIGIPVALVVAKSLGTYLNPVNKKCVPSAVAEEIERKVAQKQVEKHLGSTKTQQQTTIITKPQVVVEEKADVVSQIERLANLKEKGLLSNEEFEQQKRKLLNMPPIMNESQPEIKTITPPPIITEKEPEVKTVVPPPIKTESQPEIKTVTPPPIVTEKAPETKTVIPPPFKTEE